MAVVGAKELAETRRQHLVALAYEVESRGLSWRMAGPGESVLRVASMVTRRQVMIAAIAAQNGWTYLWAGGGIADVSERSRVADFLAHRLG